MSYLRYILFFIIIGGGILFCIRKLRFSQTLTPLLVILGNTLILYIFSLFNILLLGAYILAGVNLIFGILAFINFPKQKEKGKFVLSPAICAWIFIFVILIGYTRGLLFYGWDEFSYWGVISKYLLATNHLPDQASNFLFISYPPFQPIFHYFVSIIVGNRESSAYFAQMLLSFSALIAIFPNLTWKNWRKFLLFFSVGTISIIALDNKFQSLYVDLMIGLFFAASLVSIGFDEELPTDRFLVVLFSSTALAIIKPLGILFSLFSIAFLFYKFARISFLSNSPGEFWRSLGKPFHSIQFLLVLALPFVTLFSWTIHTAPFKNERFTLTLEESTPSSTEYALSISDQELMLKTNHLLLNEPLQINLSMKGLLNNFSVIADYHSREIVSNFVAKLSANTYYAFPITIFQAIMVIILFSLLMAKLTSLTNLKGSDFLRNATLLLAFCWVLYSISLLAAYMSYFYPSEALSVPCLDRYSASFLIGWWLFVLSYGFQNDSHEIPVLNIKSVNAIVSIILIIFLVKIPMANYLHLPYAPEPQRFEIGRIYKAVKDELNSTNEKVYIIWNSDTSKGFNHLVLKYFLTPFPSNNFGWDLGETALEYNLYKVNFSSESWMKLLIDQKYTHVVIAAADEGFWDKYGLLFDTFSRNKYPQLFLVTGEKLLNIELPSSTD